MSQRQESPSIHLKAIVGLGSLGLSFLLLVSPAFSAEASPDIEQHITKGELHAAMDKVQRQLKDQPHDFSLLLQAGELNLTLGNYKKGITLLTHAAKIDPENFRAPYHSGIAYLKQGQYALAEELLATALKLNPHNKSVQALHFLAATKNTSPTTAPEKLLKNYPLRTEYPDTYFIRAIWHYSRGEIDMAEYFVAAVADIVPHQKMLWYQEWLSDAGWIAPPRATGL